MRFSELWASAPTLPTTIENAASAASMTSHPSTIPISATRKKRIKIAKTAALVATAMKAVIGVGAPW